MENAKSISSIDAFFADHQSSSEPSHRLSRINAHVFTRYQLNQLTQVGIVRTIQARLFIVVKKVMLQVLGEWDIGLPNRFDSNRVEDADALIDSSFRKGRPGGLSGRPSLN